MAWESIYYDFVLLVALRISVFWYESFDYLRIRTLYIILLHEHLVSCLMCSRMWGTIQMSSNWFCSGTTRTEYIICSVHYCVRWGKTNRWWKCSGHILFQHSRQFSSMLKNWSSLNTICLLNSYKKFFNLSLLKVVAWIKCAPLSYVWVNAPQVHFLTYFNEFNVLSA